MSTFFRSALLLVVAFLSAGRVSAQTILEPGNRRFTGAQISVPNGALGIQDTDASHRLVFTLGSNLTADRVLTITTGDAARTIAVSGNTTISQDYSAAGAPQFARLGLGVAADGTQTLKFASTGTLSWDNGSGTADLIISRASANRFEIKNGTNAQGGWIYNTFTDASNYERVFVGWSGNVFNILPEAAGTGTNRDLKLSGAASVKISAGGSDYNFDNGIYTNVDNNKDIGEISTPFRFRSGYFGTSIGIGVTAATSTKLDVLLNNATTATIDNIATFVHDSTGTAANGFGGGLRFGLESSTTANQDAAKIAAYWKDATHASRSANIGFFTVNNAAAESEKVTIDANGNLGVGDATPAALLTVGSGDLFQVDSDGWPSGPGDKYLAANVTNNTTTMSNVSGLSVTVVGGKKYAFRLVLYVSNSTAADGAKVDFDGGTATATNFRGHATVFDSALLLSTQVTDLATDISVTTITGNSKIEVDGSFEPSSNGTFVPRFAMNTAVSGTLTVYRGAHLVVKQMP
jgi:hypothetical protein